MKETTDVIPFFPVNNLPGLSAQVNQYGILQPVSGLK